MSRAGRLLLAAAAALPIAGGLAWGMDLFWRAIGGGPMPVHGWIALTLGVTGTVLLAWGLMSLAFRSHREGWDDRVDNTLDPGRKDEP